MPPRMPTVQTPAGTSLPRGSGTGAWEALVTLSSADRRTTSFYVSVSRHPISWLLGFMSSGSGPTAPSLTPAGSCAGSRVSPCDRSQPSGAPGHDTGLEASSLNFKQRVAHKKHKIAKHMALNRPGKGPLFTVQTAAGDGLSLPSSGLSVPSPSPAHGSALPVVRLPQQVAEGYGRKPLLGEMPQDWGLGGRLGSLFQGHVLASLWALPGLLKQHLALPHLFPCLFLSLPALPCHSVTHCPVL